MTVKRLQMCNKTLSQFSGKSDFFFLSKKLWYEVATLSGQLNGHNYTNRDIIKLTSENQFQYLGISEVISVIISI